MLTLTDNHLNVFDSDSQAYLNYQVPVNAIERVIRIIDNDKICKILDIDSQDEDFILLMLKPDFLSIHFNNNSDDVELFKFLQSNLTNY